MNEENLDKAYRRKDFLDGRISCGGVMLMIHKKYFSQPVPLVSNSQVVAARVKIPGITYDITLCDIYHFIRQQVTEYFKDKSVCHDLKVKHVQGQVREWIKTDQSIPMCTGRAGWKCMSLREPKYKSSMFPVDLEAMDTILSVDEEKKVSGHE
ncbi:delta(24)-sterol reductase-like [Diaphorina citri]|uniref:Delta(24)-sterol reductase-like n=1 Tax=Diaphorina citri TaxID=121845 RepID=A0A3Q0IYW9_DIACI|nr:delta(24)-sterol reductase-like [Diaphorina citri]